MSYSKFTGLAKKLWLNHGQKFFQQITQTPLVTGLITGLHPNDFSHFTIQDIYYLELSFQPVMQILKTKASNEAHKQLFANFLAGTEIELAQLKKQVDVGTSSILKQPSHVCAAYGEYLLDTAANFPYHRALVSLLPCFTFFPLVGLHIKNRVDNLQYHPQSEWIKVYADELFENAYVMADLVNTNNEVISHEDEEQCIQLYTTSAQHELNFFKDALAVNRTLLYEQTYAHKRVRI